MLIACLRAKHKLKSTPIRHIKISALIGNEPIRHPCSAIQCLVTPTERHNDYEFNSAELTNN